MRDNKFHFGRVRQNFERLKSELPRALSTQAQAYFLDAFRNQAWEGKPWPLPKRKIPGEYAYTYPKKGAAGRRSRATLVQTGALRRSVSMDVRASHMSLRVIGGLVGVSRFPRITITSDLPYAKIHNEGGQGLAFGKYPFRMPKRQFMGNTPALRVKQIEKINQYISRIWQ